MVSQTYINKKNQEYNPNNTMGSTQVSPHPYIGFVKRNDDPQHMGRLSVYIPEIGGDPTQESSWIICGYCSHFGGATDIKKIPNYQTNPEVAQQSYGFVGVPPDLDVEVMVVFVNGELSRAYWLGFPLQQNMSQMLPGIGSSPTTGGQAGPSLEYNKGTTTGSTSNPSRPAFQPLTSGLNTQGTMSDTERGSATTSMQRESPPKMLGYLSPRGNTMHIDDDPGNEFIRLRTRGGTQLLVNETTGYVYINSKTGNSWVEVSDDGIRAYSAGDISLRSGGAFNVHADGDLNLDAGGNINIRAGSNWNRQGANINDYATGSLQVVHSVGLSGSSASDGNGGSTNTITSVMPSHEPWSGHPSAAVPPPPPTTTKPVYGGNASGGSTT